MDNYTKGVLTAIAVGVWVIALQLMTTHRPPPTVGDLRALRDMADASQRQEARSRILRSLPLVHVQGGSLDVTIED